MAVLWRPDICPSAPACAVALDKTGDVLAVLTPCAHHNKLGYTAGALAAHLLEVCRAKERARAAAAVEMGRDIDVDGPVPWEFGENGEIIVVRAGRPDPDLQGVKDAVAEAIADMPNAKAKVRVEE